MEPIVRKPTEAAAPSSPMLDLAPEQQTFVRAAAKEWHALSTGREWSSWMKIGAALEIGSRACMRKAKTNRPFGRPYVEAFSEWCKAAGFRNPDIEPKTRSHLLYLMQPQNREVCDNLRAAMTPADRLRIAHPDSMYKRVLKYWRERDEEGRPKRDKQSK